MNKSYYQRPSALGAPIIDLFDIDTSQDCISSIETCEVIHGWDFCHCSILKYLWRLGAKNSDIQSDCDKILDYIDRAIANHSVITETLHEIRAEVNKLQQSPVLL